MRFPIRKYVYFSDEALKAMSEGDKDMIEYYKEFLLEPERILKMDVCLLTDSYFKPMSAEQEEFIRQCQKTSLCKEVVLPSPRVSKAISRLENMSHEEFKDLCDKN